MNLRRIPVIPTVLVLAAVVVMLRLGFWQLDRLHQKEALLARYQSALSLSAEVPWPADPAARTTLLFRRSTIDCRPARAAYAVAGHNAGGATGWAQVQPCRLEGGGQAEAILGWSSRPETVAWSGGRISGTIGPSAGGVVRLTADPPLAGLAANAVPDPRAIPNNHLSYAVQWFLFALTALVIYAIALRKRLAAGTLGG